MSVNVKRSKRANAGYLLLRGSNTIFMICRRGDDEGMGGLTREEECYILGVRSSQILRLNQVEGTYDRGSFL